MTKAKEEALKIEKALHLFQSFVREENAQLRVNLLNTLNNNYAFKNSFDLYHIAFAQSYGCQKLITFDKGFTKFRPLFDLDIEIL